MGKKDKAAIRRGERQRQCIKGFYKDIVKKSQASGPSNLSNVNGRVRTFEENELLIRSFIIEYK